MNEMKTRRIRIERIIVEILSRKIYYQINFDLLSVNSILGWSFSNRGGFGGPPCFSRRPPLFFAISVFQYLGGFGGSGEVWGPPETILGWFGGVWSGIEHLNKVVFMIFGVKWPFFGHQKNSSKIEKNHNFRKNVWYDTYIKVYSRNQGQIRKI